MFNQVINYLNAAIGRKQEFADLIAAKDISRIITKMDSRREQTLEALREYDPTQHKINKRHDKIILDKVREAVLSGNSVFPHITGVAEPR